MRNEGKTKNEVRCGAESQNVITAFQRNSVGSSYVHFVYVCPAFGPFP
jgi:hypothetical protein